MKKSPSIAEMTVFCLVFMGCTPQWTETEQSGFNLINNEGGQTLGRSLESGVNILTVDRLAFKDLNKNGALDLYD